MSLITDTEARDVRGWIDSSATERELLRRARSAARLEMRGASYSPEDRADVAADILATTLAKLPTAKTARRKRARKLSDAALIARYRPQLADSDLARPYALALRALAEADSEAHAAPIMPTLRDSRASLTAFCDLAKTRRRSIDRERKRDALAAQLASDRAAYSRDALAADAQAEAEAEALSAQTPAEALALTDAALRRLGYRHDAPLSVRTLIYRGIRANAGADSADVARELSTTRSSVDRRASEAVERIARDWDAASFMRALTDSAPRVRWHWRSVPTLLTTRDSARGRRGTLAAIRSLTLARVAPLGIDYASADMSAAARHPGETFGGRSWRERAADWRTGTASTGGCADPDRLTLPIDTAPQRIMLAALPADATDAERDARRAAASAAARALGCKLSRERKRTPKLASVPAHVRADALANVARALSAGQNDAQRERARQRSATRRHAPKIDA